MGSDFAISTFLGRDTDVYLTPDDVLAIDHIVSEEFRATGKRPRRSEVVSRAIQVYAEQHEAGAGG